MTTLAIIGNGIAARSLIYSLAKAPKQFSRILVFSSKEFANPCSFNSTAIVAPRGVSSGHSSLGDLLVEGIETFAKHFEEDQPHGVQKIIQYTGASEKLDQFKKRYPHGDLRSEIEGIELHSGEYFAEEVAYMVDPTIYLNWLVENSNNLPLQFLEEFVISVIPGQEIQIKTLNGNEYRADKLVFCTGTYSRFYKQFYQNKKLNSSKPIQGSYMRFENVSLDTPSLSITFNGNNFIFNKELKRVLIGSTTSETNTELPALALTKIYQSLGKLLKIELPDLNKGIIHVGIREKCSKREPYLFSQDNCYFSGGLYKNGYILGLKLAQDLSRQLST
ncbi:MAG: FAD-dependent oxidoreductase [Bacteriovoracaceae bacterium]